MTYRWIWLALLAAAPLAVAQTSPAKKELVNKVLASQQPGIESVARGLVEQSVARLVQAAARALQTQVAPDKREATAKTVDAEVRKYLDEVVPLLRDRATKLSPTVIGPMLEEKFSEDELRQLAAWLESPLNKKYLQAAPEMQNALVEKLVADNRGVIEPKLKVLEERVMTALGVPPTQTPASAPSMPAKPAKPAASAPARKP